MNRDTNLVYLTQLGETESRPCTTIDKELAQILWEMREDISIFDHISDTVVRFARIAERGSDFIKNVQSHILHTGYVDKYGAFEDDNQHSWMVSSSSQIRMLRNGIERFENLEMDLYDIGEAKYPTFAYVNIYYDTGVMYGLIARLRIVDDIYKQRYPSINIKKSMTPMQSDVFRLGNVVRVSHKIIPNLSEIESGCQIYKELIHNDVVLVHANKLF